MLPVASLPAASGAPTNRGARIAATLTKPWRPGQPLALYAGGGCGDVCIVAFMYEASAAHIGADALDATAGLAAIHRNVASIPAAAPSDVYLISGTPIDARVATVDAASVSVEVAPASSRRAAQRKLEAVEAMVASSPEFAAAVPCMDAASCARECAYVLAHAVSSGPAFTSPRAHSFAPRLGRDDAVFKCALGHFARTPSGGATESASALPAGQARLYRWLRALHQFGCARDGDAGTVVRDGRSETSAEEMSAPAETGGATRTQLACMRVCALACGLSEISHTSTRPAAPEDGTQRGLCACVRSAVSSCILDLLAAAQRALAARPYLNVKGAASSGTARKGISASKGTTPHDPITMLEALLLGGVLDAGARDARDTVRDVHSCVLEDVAVTSAAFRLAFLAHAYGQAASMADTDVQQGVSSALTAESSTLWPEDAARACATAAADQLQFAELLDSIVEIWLGVLDRKLKEIADLYALARQRMKQRRARSAEVRVREAFEAFAQHGSEARLLAELESVDATHVSSQLAKQLDMALRSLRQRIALAAAGASALQGATARPDSATVPSALAVPPPVSGGSLGAHVHGTVDNVELEDKSAVQNNAAKTTDVQPSLDGNVIPGGEPAWLDGINDAAGSEYYAKADNGTVRSPVVHLDGEQPASVDNGSTPSPALIAFDEHAAQIDIVSASGEQGVNHDSAYEEAPAATPVTPPVDSLRPVADQDVAQEPQHGQAEDAGTPAHGAQSEEPDLETEPVVESAASVDGVDPGSGVAGSSVPVEDAPPARVAPVKWTPGPVLQVESADGKRVIPVANAGCQCTCSVM